MGSSCPHVTQGGERLQVKSTDLSKTATMRVVGGGAGAIADVNGDQMPMRRSRHLRSPFYCRGGRELGVRKMEVAVRGRREANLRFGPRQRASPPLLAEVRPASVTRQPAMLKRRSPGAIFAIRSRDRSVTADSPLRSTWYTVRKRPKSAAKRSSSSPEPRRSGPPAVGMRSKRGSARLAHTVRQRRQTHGTDKISVRGSTCAQDTRKLEDNVTALTLR